MVTSSTVSNNERIDMVVMRLLCEAASAMQGISRRMIIGGFIKPISHARCSKLRHASHKEVNCSKHQIKKELGRYNNSKKKMIDERSKKQLKKGPKISVLMGDKREMGNPHPIKNGREMNDIKSCNCMLLSNDCHMALCFFIII